MHAIDLIRRKHAGGKLSPAEIVWLVRGVVSGDIPQYQLSALLMAICYEHLSFDETVALTRAFVDSGSTLSWPTELGTFVDKHSTGGVGDKISLILLPLLASMGFKVAKMSGRALGHTGGTIDKLESIPGFSTNLTQAEMLKVIQDVGCCIVEQSADLVPADKLFYALRDATDTVSELGLIAASVMSKKIACGAPYIVLDVKCGSGAFFKTLEDSRAFAQLAIRIGEQFGRKVGCVISSMEQPLGRATGNALEVMEALHFFRETQQVGIHKSLYELGELVTQLGHLVIVLRDYEYAPQNYTGMLKDSRLSPNSLVGLEHTFKAWIAAQGGDLAAFVSEYAGYFQVAGIDVRADTDGFVTSIDVEAVGSLLSGLGAGRSSAKDLIDAKVGLLTEARVGQEVKSGDKLATLFLGGSGADPKDSANQIKGTFSIGASCTEPVPIVLETLF
ncbi:MAG: thymidine phosphorylase [bacterium]|nr:thymidine phosphorylase [bacterium]